MAKTDTRIDLLRNKIAELESELEAEELLRDIWLELGPYTNAISNKLMQRLQNFFDFDDSE